MRDLFRWLTTRKPVAWRDVPKVCPASVPQQRVEGSALRCTFITHSTVLIQTQGLNILTDPIWSRRCGPLGIFGPRRFQAPGVRLRHLPPIDAVVISHNHYDHFDKRTLWRLRRRFDPLICVGLGNGAGLRRRGFSRVEEFGWWHTRELRGGISVTFVPAQHFSRRGVFDHNRTLWGGYILNTHAGAIYFAGDTGFGPLFEQIKERFPKVRLALLPIGAYSPRWFMSPVHMSPDDAVQAHQILGAQSSVGIHHGTFRLSDEGFHDPVNELAIALRRRQVPSETFRALKPGEGWDIPQLNTATNSEV